MNTNHQGRLPLYNNSLKIAIAREYLTGNKGYGALALKHNLPSANTVRHFVRWYRAHYPDLPEKQPPAVIDLTDNTTPPDSAKQLKEANLKIAGLQMLIENAQKELGVDLVKKFGTKQLSK